MLSSHVCLTPNTMIISVPETPFEWEAKKWERSPLLQEAVWMTCGLMGQGGINVGARMPSVQGIFQTGSNPSEVLGVSELLVWCFFPDKDVRANQGTWHSTTFRRFSFQILNFHSIFHKTDRPEICLWLEWAPFPTSLFSNSILPPCKIQAHLLAIPNFSVVCGFKK